MCRWAGEGAELGRRGAKPGPSQIFVEMHNVLFIIASLVPVQGGHSEVPGERVWGWQYSQSGSLAPAQSGAPPA